MRPRHGNEIIGELGEKLGKKPSLGQIYPMLRNFEKNKLVTHKIVRIGDRKRKAYTLIETGKNTTARILGSFGDIISTILEPKLKARPLRVQSL